jgi:hypothetical protein
MSVPRSAPVVRTLHDARPGLPTRLAVRDAAQAMPRGMPGGAIVGVRGAYDSENGANRSIPVASARI